MSHDSAPQGAAPPGAAAAPAGDAVPEDLWRLRRSIDNIDTALVHILAERFRVTREVGVLKAIHRLPPVDSSREEAQVARLRGMADRAGLDADFAETFIRSVMAEVVRQHGEIAAERRGA